MSPTTAPSDDGGASPVRGADPTGEAARERSQDVQMEVMVAPPEGNPPLPFVTWPVPPKDIGEVDA